MRRLFRLLGLQAVLTCLIVHSAHAQQRAGDATRVQQDASQTQAGRGANALVSGDTVYRQALLETARFGSADILLDDQTRLVIGPDSDVTIDEYVYAPANSASRATLSLGIGVLRLVSGRLPKEGVSVRTPIATVGIRGTDFTLDTRTPGLLRVWVEDGEVEITPNESGLVFDFSAFSQVDCTANFCRQGGGGAVPRAFPPRGGGNDQTGFGTENDPDNAGGEGNDGGSGGRQ